ncbi:MAG: PA14 domain-containing protein [Nannocystaceae bacterium]
MPQGYDRLSRWLLLFHVVLVALTFRDYGLTWDEGYHLGYGAHIARFFGSGFHDHGALTYRLDYLYGGGFDLLGAIVRGLFPWLDRYEAVHLLGAMIGVLGLWGAQRLARRLAGPRAGFAALVMLSLTHVYYGHMFNNPKDLPFAVGYVWALDLLVAAIDEFPRITRGTAVRLAIAMGMAMSVRIGGLLLLCYFGAAILIFAARRGLAQRSIDAAYRYAARLSLQAAAITAGAWAIMLVWWPWAMFDPLRRPLIALTRMSSFVYHRRKMEFDGEWISTLDTPPDYLLHYFAYKMPEAILGLFAVGVVGAMIWLAARGPQLRNLHRAIAVVVLGLALFFPPLYAAYKGSVLYDGLRHFLFLVPVMVVVAAVTYEHGVRWLSARLGRVGVAVSILAAVAFCGEHLSIALRYHPHHYVWFNHIAGGLPEVVGRYSTDYYGETFKETASRLAVEVWRREPEAYLSTIYKVSGCLSRSHVKNYMPGNFIHQSQKKRPDFWIGYTRDKCSERYATYPQLVLVERDGASSTPLVTSAARRGGPRASPRRPQRRDRHRRARLDHRRDHRRRRHRRRAPADRQGRERDPQRTRPQADRQGRRRGTERRRPAEPRRPTPHPPAEPDGRRVAARGEGRDHDDLDQAEHADQAGHHHHADQAGHHHADQAGHHHQAEREAADLHQAARDRGPAMSVRVELTSLEAATREVAAANAVLADPTVDARCAAIHLQRAWEALGRALGQDGPPTSWAPRVALPGLKDARRSALLHDLGELPGLAAAPPEALAESPSPIPARALLRHVADLRRICGALTPRPGVQRVARGGARWLLRGVGWGAAIVALFVAAVRPWQADLVGPWRAAYYASEHFEGEPVMHRYNDIDFRWGLEAPLDVIPGDWFSAYFDTCITVNEDADITFQIVSDDGARLYLDGKPIIDNWGRHAVISKGATTRVEAGIHHLKIEYFEHLTDAELHLMATFDPSEPPTQIPRSLLRYPESKIDAANPCAAE